MPRRAVDIWSRMGGQGRLVATSAGVACALAGLLWCSSSRLRVASARAHEASGDVGGRAERRAHVEDRMLLTGEIQAIRSHRIVVPRTTSWQVQIKWLAEDGSEVEAGAPVVEFDNTSILQSIEDKRIRVRTAESALETRSHAMAAELEKKQLAVEKARLEAERARLDAAVPSELRPRKEWNQIQTTLEENEMGLAVAEKELARAEISNRAETENLRLELEKARRDLATAEEALAALSVKAPHGGIVMIEDYFDRWREDRKYVIGDVLYPGLVVASMPELSEMEVVAWLPDVDDGKVAPGMRARCILDTFPDRAFEGDVAEVGVVAQERGDASAFQVRISLADVDSQRMLPGMSVRVEVLRRAWDDALVVPRAAVGWDGSVPRVRLQHGSTVDVTLAGCTPTECVVESGIEEGARVRL